MKRLIIVGIVALLAASPALAGFTVPPNRPGAYAPRDECAKTLGTRAFTASLRGAIARRDVRAIVDMAASDIRLDFGGGSGRAELRRQLAGAEGPALWREFEEAVNLGCAISEGDMVFPWLFAQNLGDVDPFDALVVTGPSVPLYARANARAAPIARLNWQLVIAQGDGLAQDARKRSLRRISVINSPLEGYVPTGSLRSPLARRLIVSRHGPEWKIAAFVAGD
jgi:hypothetical protein